MPTLQDLSSELPTDEDLTRFTQYIIEESDRGAAVMASALVELALTDAIKARVANPGETIVKTWFVGPLAPFSSFSSKISLGRALCIYGEHMEARLNLIRAVRNAFAHRVAPLSFDHPTVAAACRKLSPRELLERPPKILFGAACLTLAGVLGNDAFDKGNRLMDVTFP